MKRILLSIASCALLRGASDSVPDWVRQAAAQTVPSYSAKVTSVVLLNEETVTVSPDGSRVMRERGAVKILQASGETIEAYRTYDTKAGRIRDFQGWMIPVSGKPVTFAKNRILDVALSREYVYDEARAKVLEFGQAPPGTVMAWEITEEEKNVFTQEEFRFQQRLPVVMSRFTLNLPASWVARGQVFNHAPVGPAVAEASTTWEIQNLPWIERESFAPSTNELAPRLVVSYFPPAENPAHLQGLKDWSAVSSWLTPMVDPSADVTDSIRAKAKELTANAASEIDKIAAIGKFVQQTSYVEVSLNVARGGGYTPHKASDSLTKNYGDCKDKATLMRALLKAVDIDSYLTTITSGERTYVRPEWASPTQFNHAIIAVSVSDQVKLPTVIPDNPVGRLLIFDPTDPFTQVGDLPESEQGSYALVIAGARGALLKMPVLPPDAQRVESAVEATLDDEGSIRANVRRQYFGQSAIPLRAFQRTRGDEDIKKRLERAFTRGVGGATLSEIKTEDHPNDHRVNVQLQLDAQRFGQIMQGRLLVVHPGLLGSTEDYFFASRQRNTPVQLDADLHRDSIRIKLPAGFKVDEIPGPANIETPYGTLTASWSVKDDEILMQQTFETRAITAPSQEFPKIRDFFDRVAGARSAPVVLVKK